jgi:hypothetical protein
MRWARHIARMAKERNALRILVAKSEGKRQLGGPRHRREDNINTDFRDIGWDVMD